MAQKKFVWSENYGQKCEKLAEVVKTDAKNSIWDFISQSQSDIFGSIWFSYVLSCMRKRLKVVRMQFKSRKVVKKESNGGLEPKNHMFYTLKLLKKVFFRKQCWRGL